MITLAVAGVAYLAFGHILIPLYTRRPTMTDTTTTELDEKLDQLLGSRILCLGCIADHHRAIAAGTPADQLPMPNTANVIVQGNGQCFNHVQFTDRPILPGQTAGGLFLPGAGA